MIRYLFDNLEELLGNVLLTAVCVPVCIKISSRYAYILGNNFFSGLVASAASWSEEVCTYLFIWMVFVGASLAYKRKQHFAVEFIIDRLDKKYAGYMHIFITVLVIIFSLIIICQGVIQTCRGFFIITPVLEIPRSIPYAAIPVGGMLILIRAVELLVKQIRGEDFSP